MEKNMDMMKFAPEPFKIKMVENMARLDREEHGYDEICTGAFQDQNGRKHGTFRQRRA